MKTPWLYGSASVRPAVTRPRGPRLGLEDIVAMPARSLAAVFAAVALTSVSPAAFAPVEEPRTTNVIASAPVKAPSPSVATPREHAATKWTGEAAVASTATAGIAGFYYASRATRFYGDQAEEAMKSGTVLFPEEEEKTASPPVITVHVPPAPPPLATPAAIAAAALKAADRAKTTNKAKAKQDLATEVDAAHGDALDALRAAAKKVVAEAQVAEEAAAAAEAAIKVAAAKAARDAAAKAARDAAAKAAVVTVATTKPRKAKAQTPPSTQETPGEQSAVDAAAEAVNQEADDELFADVLNELSGEGMPVSESIIVLPGDSE